MQNRMNQFLRYFRNFLVLSYAWLVLLATVLCAAGGKTELRTATLLKLFGFCFGAALFFALTFSRVLIRRKGFMFRLTIFLILFVPLEIACFYSIGLFSGAAQFGKWMLFVGIIGICYVVSLLVDLLVLRRKGREYTALLEAYR